MASLPPWSAVALGHIRKPPEQSPLCPASEQRGVVRAEQGDVLLTASLRVPLAATRSLSRCDAQRTALSCSLSVPARVVPIK